MQQTCLRTGTTGREDLAVSRRVETIIVEIDSNTKKSPGDLRRLADTSTPVKNSQMSEMMREFSKLTYQKYKNKHD